MRWNFYPPGYHIWQNVYSLMHCNGVWYVTSRSTQFRVFLVSQEASVACQHFCLRSSRPSLFDISAIRCIAWCWHLCPPLLQVTVSLHWWGLGSQPIGDSARTIEPTPADLECLTNIFNKKRDEMTASNFKPSIWTGQRRLTPSVIMYWHSLLPVESHLSYLWDETTVSILQIVPTYWIISRGTCC